MGVSLKKQKILMFIPFANAFILFVWLYNYSKTQRDTSVFLRSVLIIFTATVPLAILQIILERAFPNIRTVLGYIMAYLIPLSMAFCLIRFQERLYEND